MAQRHPDPGLCPLCGAPNGCALAGSGAVGGEDPAPCWCTRVDIAPSTLARIPPAAQRLVCICRACAGASPQGDLAGTLNP